MTKDYSKSVIYRIICNVTKEIYIGSTTDFKTRQKGHRTVSNSTSSKQIIERGNYIFQIIEYFPCNSKKELHTKERYYIENNLCINKTIPTRTHQEYHLDTYNPEKSREYYLKNKEKIIERQKAPKWERNDPKICICGKMVTRPDCQKRHEKSKKHLDFINNNKC